MRRRDLSLPLVALGLALVVVAVVTDEDAEPRRAFDDAAVSTVEETVADRLDPAHIGADGLGDPYFPGLGNGGYDVAHYDLELEWYAPELWGLAEITATATQDLDRFNLDLAGLEVLDVRVDGTESTFVHEGRELVITPAEGIEEGDEFDVRVQYHGVPEPISEGTGIFDVGWHTDGDEVFVVNEPSGAATFFPSNDHPSDKATFAFHVEAATEQVVAANGVLVGEPQFTDEGGGRIWTYEMVDPMATYLVQVAIGDYELITEPAVDGVTIRHAIHRSQLEEGRAVVAETPELLGFLTELLGPYPFDVYGVVAVDESLGFALETQTLTLIGSDIVAEGERSTAIMLHELAHHWFGDSVSPATWRDIWLNEGFATYLEWLYAERTTGLTAAELARGTAGGSSAPELDEPAGDPGADELFSATVYLRGAMTLQALREEIGDDLFFQLLRAWAGEDRHGNASTGDFIALAEAVSGRDLDGLFEAWLYAEELPAFR